MTSSVNRYEFNGYSVDGGDPIASVAFSPPSFQGGLSISDAFIENVRSFIAAQQNVATVVITKVETVTSTF